jgi:hypothetical protein
MFSPVKAITAGALVFALGGVLLIAQPFDQQRGTVPGAATDAEFVAPVEVTGVGLEPASADLCSQTRQDGDETTLPGSNEQYTCTTSWSFSDDRLSGRLTRIRDNVWLVGNGLETAEALSVLCAEDAECEVPDLQTVHSAMSLENEGGLWRQRPTVMFFVPGGCCADADGFIVMDGEEGYEGLVAVLEATGQEEDTTYSYYGFILDARQLKPAPENASTK